MKAFLGMCGKVLLVLLLAGGIIGVLGYKQAWNTSIAYSNAFFFAGCLLIIAGTSSRFIFCLRSEVFSSLQAAMYNESLWRRTISARNTFDHGSC
jgi:hypothetical protein